MATAAAGWSCVHSTSVVAETNTNKTIRVTCYWHNSGHLYDINYVYGYVYCIIDGVKDKREIFTNGHVSAMSDNTSYSLGYSDFVVPKGTSAKSVECYAKITSNSSYVSGTKYSTSTFVDVAAKPYHTITYNANGGTGAPSAQTKWYSESITLSTTKPTRTGHSFLNWCTNTANTGTKYNPGDTYSSNANLLLYAIWKANTYTVTYNANGGTGAPANQTKTYGVDLTLSTTKPTRTNYNFLGWATSANGGVVYASGAKYTNNNAVTLYAVWEVAYVKPRINNFTATRCTSDGTISESGTYIKIVFDWATDLELTAINVQYKLLTATTWGGGPLSSSGTNSGSVNQAVGQGNISTDASYQVRVYVSDSGGTTYSTTLTIGTINYPIDVKKGGTGIAFGKAAENADELDSNWYGRFRKGLIALKQAMFEQGTSVKRVNNGHGTSGYILACRLTITQNYQNQFITFGVTQRNRYGELHLCFASGDTKDPGINTFKKIGNIEAYIVKNTTSVWDLYIAKSEAYDDIEIVELHKGGYMSGVTIQWINTIASSLPTGYTRAWGSFSINNGSFNIDSADSGHGYKTNGNMILRNNGQNTVLSALNGYNIYLRPNGDTSDTGRVLIKTDGSITAYGGATRIYGAKVLYENASGGKGTLTLSETAANFNYIWIFYAYDGSSMKSIKIHNPNGKKARLGSESGSYLYYKDITFSGTSVTVTKNGRSGLHDTSTDTTEYIAIFQIAGEK